MIDVAWDEDDGLDVFQRAALSSLCEMGATSSAPWVKSSRVLAHALDVREVPSVEELLRGGPEAEAAAIVRDLFDRIDLASVDGLGPLVEETHALYLSLVHLAQPFVAYRTLVEARGNIGSIDGDEPADVFYTECRLSTFAEQLFDSSNAPRLPVGLVIGSYGDGGVPAHRVDAIARSCLALLRDPNAAIDWGSPCVPEGSAHFAAPERFAREGRSELVLTGRVRVEGRTLFVEALPWLVHKAAWHASVGRMVRLGKLPELREVVDESDHDGVSMRVELAPNVSPTAAKARLEALLTVRRPVELRVQDADGDVVSVSPRELVLSFLRHRRNRFRSTKAFEADLAAAASL